MYLHTNALLQIYYVSNVAKIIWNKSVDDSRNRQDPEDAFKVPLSYDRYRCACALWRYCQIKHEHVCKCFYARERACAKFERGKENKSKSNVYCRTPERGRGSESTVTRTKATHVLWSGCYKSARLRAHPVLPAVYCYWKRFKKSRCHVTRLQNDVSIFPYLLVFCCDVPPWKPLPLQSGKVHATRVQKLRHFPILCTCLFAWKWMGFFFLLIDTNCINIGLFNRLIITSYEPSSFPLI